MHGIGLCFGDTGMVSIGLKALPLRKHKSRNLCEDSLMADEGTSSNDRVKDRKMGRKGSKKNAGFHGGASTENQSGGVHKKFAKDKPSSVHQASYVRKQVDPETAKYFTEISNVIEGAEIDLEERSVICGNALEEARGKEVELATDYIISHTMQTLLQGCSVEHLCAFLRGCAENFCHISMDRSGSHVAETALKSLARHLDDDENHSLIEETLSTLCQAIVVNPVDIMCDCYGSHVLRRLLCLCKGVPVDSSEFHSIKPSVVLAERLNLRSSQLDGHESQQNQPFPDQLKFLISEMLNPLRSDIAILQVNQYSSLVLQTALKLLAGKEEELFSLVPVLLGCHTDNALEGNFIEVKAVKKILRLVEENAYSHLMEVILAVAPDTLYNEIFTKVFKDSLFRMSSHPSANFVVQALISHARNQEHIKLIYEELGSRFKSLVELGRSGVIAALIAASQRLEIHEQKCCKALADAVCLTNESSACIVPRMLFLDNYFYAVDKANWNWPSGVKMHVLGSLMLQSIFRFPSEFIQAYITSITSLEENQVLEASKDPAGARVIEAFLTSNASAKQKRKLVSKLRGHFGELSVLPSGSFTVEKCFSASNLSLRETIVSELLPVQAELSKTKQGPYLLKKLDVESFSKRPDHWRSRQTSKESAYKEFYAAFGPMDTKSSRSENFLSDTHHKSMEKLKGMRKEIDARLSSGYPPKSGTPFLAHQGSVKPRKPGNKQVPEGREFPRDVGGDSFQSKSKKHKIEKTSISSENNNDGETLHGDKSSNIKNEKKRRRKDGLSKSLDKKLKAGISD
ncbi:Pumilio23 [Sesamum alatum]|uniref:Pumilio23 n=1 Tax=Sesamum alatum TaxID=300844 RepID=A0AAE1YBY6_9LAMI|nr:Pumilio23 [Sesamum alatum]